jgi:chaperonin GroES
MLLALNRCECQHGRPRRPSTRIRTAEQALTLDAPSAAAGLPINFKGDQMKMKLRPLHDRVVVKRLEQETKTASGIVIPDSAAEKPDQGEVLAIGPGKRNDKGDFMALNVKVGDRVLFGKYSGQTVKVDGDELLVMREEDLFAVVEK